jgi:predicted RNase H-like nuclease (RuvC/YqgF family)
MNQTKAEYYVEENQRLTEQLEQAQRTIHSLNTQLTNKRLEIESLKSLLAFQSACAVGERGDVCTAIDGGNL